MLDPLPLRNPPWLQKIAVPIAEKFSLPALPLHAHEVLFAFSLYHVVLVYLSPALSTFLFPQSYPKLSPRTRFNWDVHVVSFVQSVIVCALAFYVMRNDHERAAMGWQERVYGYTGALGLTQAFACGYFLWDFYICVRHVKLFGLGMLAHAIAALTVYSVGFTPFVHYYSPIFILYELSSPFLNIHWFCDKLNKTGGTLQMINGILLLLTFLGCRLLYGSYMSVRMYWDIWTAFRAAAGTPNSAPLVLSPFALNATTLFNSPIAALQVVQFAPKSPHLSIPMVVAVIASNITVNTLNWYWYGKMIDALRKRFDPPLGTKRKEKVEKEVSVERRVDTDSGTKTLEVNSVEVRRRAPMRAESDDSIPPPT